MDINNKTIIPDIPKTYKLSVSKDNSHIQIPGMALLSNAGLPIHSPNTPKKKAIVFVDANNWYHNVKKLFRPSDVSIIKIANLICHNLKLSLQEIRWYVSIPDIGDGERVDYEHMRFLSDLENLGVKIITRKLQRLSNQQFLKKKQETINCLDLCKFCRPLIESTFLDLTDLNRKEKGIDVWIAIDMVKKSVVDYECDVCVLISGDTDFVPAINLINQAGKRVVSAFVPYGYSTELRNSTEYFILRKETLVKCFRDYNENKNKGDKLQK